MHLVICHLDRTFLSPIYFAVFKILKIGTFMPFSSSGSIVSLQMPGDVQLKCTLLHLSHFLLQLMAEKHLFQLCTTDIRDVCAGDGLWHLEDLCNGVTSTQLFRGNCSSPEGAAS